MQDEQAVDRAARQYLAATDAARQWQGWGTALKPAWEPVILARKPLSEKTVAANVLRWGTGALNIDECRTAGEVPQTTQGADGGKDLCPEGMQMSQPHAAGRWPANVVHDGSEEVVEMFPVTSGSSSYLRSAPAKSGHFCGPVPKGGDVLGYNDPGSAARFFYCPKASKADRAGSKHPTVKPVNLMRWLCKLVTPPGGLVLDPFAGSGTTGLAAVSEGFRAVLCEAEDEYVADMRNRFGGGIE
jgi:site-specific DNA-methyltransferase (adenine-specific)